MVNDYFRGTEISALTGDKFAKRFIEDDMLVEDITLMDCKWWDYRVWHPTKATFYFYHRFNELAVEAIRKHIGDKEADQYRRALPKFNLQTRPVATIRAFWKARMTADALGVPYDIYIRNALDNFYSNYHILATTKNAKREQKIPYPNQLTSKFIIERVIKDWDAETKLRLCLPENTVVRTDKDLWFRQEMEVAVRNHCHNMIDRDRALAYATKVGLLTSPA